MLRIGVDIGGTKIEALALDASGRELARKRIPTPQNDYAASVRAVRDLVLEIEHKAGGKPGDAKVGFAIPGALSLVTGLVKNANSTWLNNKPFDRDLSEALSRPIRLNNDANCFAVSEATDGAAQGAHVVFGVILGTGVGGGIVVDGKPLTGINAIGGEWGHNPLPWPEAAELPGASCYCGRYGCIETWLSGPALAADHQKVTGEKLLGPDIVARSETGDAKADATLMRYESRLARALATVINLLDPDVIVLGGGLGQIQRLYQNVPALLGQWCFSDKIVTPIRLPKYGDSSGVRGAAWLWGRTQEELAELSRPAKAARG